MKYSPAKLGRVFVIRLEDGDIIHETLEQFAIDHQIHAASLIIVGGADHGSKLVVGPEADRANPIVPLHTELKGAHEVTGTGTIFPNTEGIPILHMHLACGRREQTITGCIRRGVKTWHILEVVLTELLDSSAKRLPDTVTGFELLVP